MIVKKITPRGYCHGVVNALKIICDLINNGYDKQIYILGMIVHNEIIISALEEYNIITIDDKSKNREQLLDLIDDGLVIFTAHGISPKVVKKTELKKLDYIDASCVDVLKTHRIIKDHILDGYSIIYIGKKNHPEPEGVLGIDDDIHLVSSIKDIKSLNLSNNKIMVTNQTTMSLYDIFYISEAIKNKYGNAHFIDEICNSTRIRQLAIKDHNACINFVVGDKNSNNTKKLSELSNVQSHRISSVHDLNIELLKDKKIVSVSSGASTPTALTNQVISFLEQFDYNDKSTHKLPKQLSSKKILSFIK